MSLINKLNVGKPAKRKIKFALVSKFTLTIGLSVFISVFFVSAYNLYASVPIMNQYRTDQNQHFDSISNVLYNSAINDLKSENNFNNTYQLAKNLVNNNLILYSELINNKTGKALWATSKDSLNNNSLENVQRINFQIDDKLLVVAFYDENSFANIVNLLVKGNMILSVVFIVFGFWLAFILAKYVTLPVKKLVDGAGEFSRGNLKFRTDVQTEDEIGILAHSFNEMAEKLSELYSSLEQKVMERTHELSKKNLELKHAYKDLTDTQSMLVHNEKMRSLGQLVAGVAHELNNPINFIYGNLIHMKNYTNDLLQVISKYEEVQKLVSDDVFNEIDKLKEEVEYDFIAEDICELIKSCTEGAERSKQIILGLKNFSRLDEAQVKEVDIHEGIESSLNILENKFKDKIKIYKQYGNLPHINCYPGQINQVFMNILDNGAQAATEGSGNVYIRTKLEDDNAVIEFEDTGPGIDEEVLPKIFDPFFTTKAVGEGTGLGLSICYKIIKSHNGKIEVESEKGKGTKFIIKLPINWSEQNNSETEEKEEA